MLDLLGTIFTIACYATIVGMLIALTRIRPATALAGFAAAALWLTVVVAAAASGILVPGALGPVPGPVLLFILMLAALFGGWVFIAPFRRAILSVPLPMLIAVHGFRLGGVFFLLLWADGRLAAPFAPSAGLGDMITGAVALPLAALLALGIEVRRSWLLLWNAFGVLDLVVAVTLGGLSAPGAPYRVFTEGAGTQAMTTLPWLFVPALLVPMLLLLHAATAARLRRPQAIDAVAVAG